MGVAGYILTVRLWVCRCMWFAVMSRDLVEDCFKGGGVVFGVGDICICICIL